MGAPVEWMEEPSYFFKLSAFEVKGFYTYQVLVNKSKRAVYIDSVQREPFTSIQCSDIVTLTQCRPRHLTTPDNDFLLLLPPLFHPPLPPLFHPPLPPLFDTPGSAAGVV